MASQREAAQHIFTSPQRLIQLMREGHLPRPRGRAGYVLEDVRRAYIDYLSGRTVVTVDEESHTERQKAVDSLAVERARKEAETADKLALENQTRRGELVPLAVLGDYCEQVGAFVRATLESLAGQVKREIVHLRTSEIAKVRRICSKASDDIAGFVPSHETSARGD